MANNEKIPATVKQAFPLLSDTTFVRQFASLVPLAPDTTFDIYINSSESFMALIATDYADPHHQSQELKSVSGQHGFEFSNLVKPFARDGDTVEVLEHDNMEGDFFVTAPYGDYSRYYYLANLKHSH